MKKLLYRKLLKDYVNFFLIALVSSSLIIWVFQAVNFLDIMVEDGREYTVYINYSLLNFPKIISRLLPFVIFFSIYYVLSKYELNNELIIFWNFGENKLKFINFILFISLFLLFIQICFTSFIVPKSQDQARSFLRNSNVNFLGSFVKPKRFNDTIEGVTNKENPKWLKEKIISKFGYFAIQLGDFDCNFLTKSRIAQHLFNGGKYQNISFFNSSYSTIFLFIKFIVRVVFSFIPEGVII